MNFFFYKYYIYISMNFFLQIFYEIFIKPITPLVFLIKLCSFRNRHVHVQNKKKKDLNFLRRYKLNFDSIYPFQLKY